MRCALLFASLAALASSCAPDLDDGIYGCREGPCPDGFNCWVDGLCYRGADPTGDGCAGDDDCPGAAVCAPGLGTEDGEGTYCSASCDASEDCGDVDGTPTRCVEGVCRLTCDADDCPSRSFCHLLPPDMRDSETMNVGVCTRVDRTVLGGQTTCDLATRDCAYPGVCEGAEGIDVAMCTLHCTEDFHCTMEARCVRPFDGMGPGVCLRPCEDPMTTCPSALVCGDLLNDSSRPYCIPAEWDGQVLTHVRPPGGMMR